MALISLRLYFEAAAPVTLQDLPYLQSSASVASLASMPPAVAETWRLCTSREAQASSVKPPSGSRQGPKSETPRLEVTSTVLLRNIQLIEPRDAVSSISPHVSSKLNSLSWSSTIAVRFQSSDRPSRLPPSPHGTPDREGGPAAGGNGFHAALPCAREGANMKLPLVWSASPCEL